MLRNKEKNSDAKAKATKLTISAKTQPRLQTSTDVEQNLLPNRISGARYQRVTTSWVYVRTGIPNARASPKSASLMQPRLSIRRFCGFRSLCSTRCTWQYATPFSSWCKQLYKHTFNNLKKFKSQKSLYQDSTLMFLKLSTNTKHFNFNKFTTLHP